MDGIHDLGGKQGFGPIAVTHDDPAFHEEWEGRLYAISQTVGSEDGTIDWFRSQVELLDPRVYLNEPYFQRWHMTILADLVQCGMISKSEALGHGAEHHAAPPPALTLEDVLAADSTHDTDFSRPITATAAFIVGQTVQTQQIMSATHTRLPAYARARCGIVIAHHGAHVFPDASAAGRDEAQHLYTVEFEATDLWGPEAMEGDTVTLDLWESYLVRT